METEECNCDQALELKIVLESTQKELQVANDLAEKWKAEYLVLTKLLSNTGDE